MSANYSFGSSKCSTVVGNMIRLHADGGPDALPQNPGHGITKDLKSKFIFNKWLAGFLQCKLK